MKRNETLFLLFRYFALILLGLGNLFIIYFIFTPLTVYPSAWLLNKVTGAILIPHTSILLIDNVRAEIISACIAGAAYYLLLIFNFTTPMRLKQRIKSITFILLAFLILNIVRIVLFGSLLADGYKYFSLVHEATWYIGSTIMVIIIFFASVLIFKIKNIPFYTDIKNIYHDIVFKRTKKFKKKKK